MALNSGILDQKQRETFHEDGYLIIDPEIPEFVLSSIPEELEPRYLKDGDSPRLEGGVLYYPKVRRIRDAWHMNDNVKFVALAPKVLNVLENLYGRKPICFQTLNFAVATQQAPHSDSMHFSPDEPEYMCGVWVALEDIDMNNGPLVYYPGSHKLPFLDYDDIDFQATESQYANPNEYARDRNLQYEQHIASLIRRGGYEPRYATIKRGQAMVWAANLIHGGAALRDPNRTRHSQVSHYLFEGATGYYTAMVSEPDRRVWTEPEWVNP